MCELHCIAAAGKEEAPYIYLMYLNEWLKEIIHHVICWFVFVF